MMFSTYDRDNDRYLYRNCAAFHGGGFWYHSCFLAGVNCERDYFYWRPNGIPNEIVMNLQASRMWLTY